MGGRSARIASLSSRFQVPGVASIWSAKLICDCLEVEGTGEEGVDESVACVGGWAVGRFGGRTWMLDNIMIFGRTSVGGIETNGKGSGDLLNWLTISRILCVRRFLSRRTRSTSLLIAYKCPMGGAPLGGSPKNRRDMSKRKIHVCLCVISLVSGFEVFNMNSL